MVTTQTKKKRLAKIILLGDSSVGKTSIINRYVHRGFNRYKATIGPDFFTRDVETDENIITHQFWDTAGQERFQSLGVAFYRGTDIVVIVFDLTSRKSFENVNYWLDEFKSQTSNDNVVYALLANKCDLEDKREVTTEEIAKCAKENEFLFFFETSAKEAINTENCLSAITLAYENVLKTAPETIVEDISEPSNGWFDWCNIF